jgi:hypothetical protein
VTRDQLRYTLVSEGSSDRALLQILNWLLARHSAQPFDGVRADLGFLPAPPKTLNERIRSSIKYYPCELLFVHRDADGPLPEKRVEEIKEALAELKDDRPAVCVVPVTMSEAWLLIDEAAIRYAAGNPRGAVRLQMPKLSRIESISDPKDLLFDLLLKASERSKRRQKKLDLYECRQNVALRITNYSPLQKLSAFRALEEELKKVLKDNDW